MKKDVEGFQNLGSKYARTLLCLLDSWEYKLLDMNNLGDTSKFLLSRELGIFKKKH